MSRLAPRRGERFRFTTDTESRGWTFTAGQVVTFLDVVPSMDWFEHMVRTEAGESRRIGAGVLDLHAERIGPGA